MAGAEYAMLRRAPVALAVSFLVAFLLIGTRGAFAQAATPILRIETGGHSGRVMDAATDAAGRTLVTVSEDKTARVWSLPELRPLAVLRPAIGTGAGGMLRAVAVSPDGKLVAVGGLTNRAGDDAVLVFDVATGQIVRRLGGLRDGLSVLAFSRDGGRLAAGGQVYNGVLVWDTTDWRRSFAIAPYRGDVLGLSFAPDGRLATGAADGGLRLYARDGRRLAETQVLSGKNVCRIAFNPEGTLLAVGIETAYSIEVRDGLTLAPRTQPDLSGAKATQLCTVAWSADGQTLFGASNYWNSGRFPIFAWDEAGHGPRGIADPGFPDKVIAMPAQPYGQVLVSSRGELAVLDTSGHRIAGRAVVGQDLASVGHATNVTRRLPVSMDATQVGWVARGDRTRWLKFDAPRLDLTTEDAAPPDLIDWQDTAGSLRVTDWQKNAPQLNGHPLQLNGYEGTLSVAVTTNRVLLGSSWRLRLFNSSGGQQWEKTAPGGVSRINLSPDGKLAVGAFGDGTIRWYRREDGTELLALFVTADAKQWVAWTPSGYYAASAGGEDLIGWHLNRGLDRAADFFSASRFRDRFYRPDVVARVLNTLDETKALREADANNQIPTRPMPSIIADQPPVVTILSPRDGTQVSDASATIEYSVRSPSGVPVRKPFALINGRPVTETRAIKVGKPIDATPAPDTELRGTLEVPIPPGQTVEVTLLAETEFGRVSDPARTRLTGRPAPTATDPLLPRLNAVLVGISAYPEAYRLRFAGKDAADLSAVFERQKDLGLYKEVNVHLLQNELATRSAVLRELDWLRRATTSNDVAVVFLAGHGVQDEGRTFFLPVDGDPDQLFATAVAQTDLQGVLSRVPGRVVAFIDICHAGGAVLAQNLRELPDISALVNQLREPGSGLIVFAAATARQPAQERSDLGNGVFTSALLEGLSGRADLRHRGAVRTDELNVYIADRVRDLTGGRQSPVMQRPGDIPDFPLVVTGK